MMSERVGKFYFETKDLDFRSVSKRIKQDICAAITQGNLPRLPYRAVSVRINPGLQNGSKYSLDIQLRDLPANLAHDPASVAVLEDRVKSIADAYNYHRQSGNEEKGLPIILDVGFYVGVTLLDRDGNRAYRN